MAGSHVHGNAIERELDFLVSRALRHVSPRQPRFTIPHMGLGFTECQIGPITGRFQHLAEP